MYTPALLTRECAYNEGRLYMAFAAIFNSNHEHQWPYYNINPPGTYRFKGKKYAFNHSKTHMCIVDQNLLPQVIYSTRIKIYSWWNTVIRSAFYVLVYGKHYFAKLAI